MEYRKNILQAIGRDERLLVQGMQTHAPPNAVPAPNPINPTFLPSIIPVKV